MGTLEEGWARLFRELESREPLVRSAAYIEKSNRVFKTLHSRKCPQIIARYGRVGIECPHGRDVCPQCDKCTCKER